MTPLILLSLLAAVTPWRDASVNSASRLPMRATLETSYPTQSLNGTWKFVWYDNSGDAPSDGFYKPGADDSTWGEMPVPGLWELNGYGDPLYLNIGYAWRGHYTNNPPYAPDEHNHVGRYRRTFSVDKAWKGRRVVLTIGSATSCVKVWVNGKEAGYSEDSKLQADFDISRLLRYGADNVIALEVHRWCDGSYMEDQDFWRFSGLARDTYLTAEPQKRVDNIRITAGMDGHYVITPTYSGIKSARFLMSGPGMDEKEVALEGTVDNPQLWSAEIPNLYRLTAEWTDERGGRQTAALDFGFRTVTIEDGQLKVNGEPILIKGVNRHEMHPTRGYVVDRKSMLKDIEIMKRLNVNTVRTCHYPDDPLWYSLCDRYGLYVIDEANNESHGMGYKEATLARNPLYAQTHLERVSRMAERDVNHPCVIIWSLGNEAGDGPNFQSCYLHLKKFDPTRPVQFERACTEPSVVKSNAPWPERGYTSDIQCPMYPTYERCEEYVSDPATDKPLILCEYAHAMGNSLGGLDKYWQLIRKYGKFQGGCIWDFQDQGIVWPCSKPGTDRTVIFGGDFNDYDPSDNSFNCNGIIASDRTLHPHAYEVQYQYQNLWSALTGKQGCITVENENFFKGTDNYSLKWSVSENGVAKACGVVDSFDAAPGQSVRVDLGPEAYRPRWQGGETFLDLEFSLKRAEGLLPAGTVVARQQIQLRDGEHPHVQADLRGQKCEAGFDDRTGALNSIRIGGRELLKAPLMPCFGRAVTENDLGANFQKKMGCWLYPDFNLTSFFHEADSACAIYRVGDFATATVTYSIAGDGTITVREKLSDIKEGTPDMFRFGMEFALGGQYSDLEFFGPGPHETYSDRKSSATVGIYRQKVEDQYHWGYVRPQESGSHTDLRYFAVTDTDGTGIELSSPSLFSASALPLRRRDIDMSVTGGGRSDNTGDQRHSLELRSLVHEGERSLGGTYVNVDLCHMGLGCVNSWGRTPQKGFMIPAAELEFEFVIRPLR